MFSYVQRAFMKVSTRISIKNFLIVKFLGSTQKVWQKLGYENENWAKWSDIVAVYVTRYYFRREKMEKYIVNESFWMTSNSSWL